MRNNVHGRDATQAETEMAGGIARMQDEIHDLQTERANLREQLQKVEAERVRLIDACQGLLLTYEPYGDGSGCCSEGGNCTWHNAYSVVNNALGDQYGEWYAK